MRAFLAIPVLPPALADHARLRALLKEQVPGVRWAPAATPHVTLHFFGDLSDDAARRALDAVAAAVAWRRPIRLHLDGLGHFSDHRRPRVLWWGVAGDLDGLSGLVRCCRDGLRATGFAIDERPFRPHCTLGRPGSGWNAASEAAWRRACLAGQVSREFVSDRVVFYESVTHSSGAEHVPRFALSLRGVHSAC